MLTGFQPLSLSLSFFSSFISAPLPLRLSKCRSLLCFIIPFSSQCQKPSLHPKLPVFISLLPPHINIPQSLREQSDPSVCCRLFALRGSAISLPLLWVSMTHASIILLSFCHYYAPWTPLHLSSWAFSSLLHSGSLNLTPRFILLPSSQISSNKYFYLSSAISQKRCLPFLLLQSFVSSIVLLEMSLSKHPSLPSVLTRHGQK